MSLVSLLSQTDSRPNLELWSLGFENDWKNKAKLGKEGNKETISRCEIYEVLTSCKGCTHNPGSWQPKRTGPSFSGSFSLKLADLGLCGPVWLTCHLPEDRHSQMSLQIITRRREACRGKTQMGPSFKQQDQEPGSVLQGNIKKVVPSCCQYLFFPAVPDVLASLLFSDSSNQEPGLGGFKTRE